MGQEITERQTPASLGPFFSTVPLDPVEQYRSTNKGIGATTHTSEQLERDAREDLVDLALRRTLGATYQEREGVFPNGFPHIVKKFIPSQLILVIPNASGATSVASA